MLQHLAEVFAGPLFLISCCLFLLFCVIQVLLDPLRSIPGPFLARFTRLWYFYNVYKGDFEITNIKLHEKYGPIVRVAPNQYSVDDPDAAKTIYGHGTSFVKVGRYFLRCICSIFLLEHCLTPSKVTMVLGMATTSPRASIPILRPRSRTPRPTASEIRSRILHEFSCWL
jgi:hypothetical protein